MASWITEETHNTDFGGEEVVWTGFLGARKRNMRTPYLCCWWI